MELAATVGADGCTIAVTGSALAPSMTLSVSNRIDTDGVGDVTEASTGPSTEVVQRAGRGSHGQRDCAVESARLRARHAHGTALFFIPRRVWDLWRTPRRLPST